MIKKLHSMIILKWDLRKLQMKNRLNRIQVLIDISIQQSIVEKEIANQDQRLSPIQKRTHQKNNKQSAVKG